MHTLPVQVDVDVEMVVPERAENRPLFMVHCSLLTESGTVLRHEHRSIMLHQRPMLVQLVRHVALLPAYVMGLLDENEVAKVRSIVQHRERRRAPLAAVRVVLRAANDGLPPPLIQTARVRVDINKSAPLHHLSSTLLQLARKQCRHMNKYAEQSAYTQ
jgi:hypothetical protein